MSKKTAVLVVGFALAFGPTVPANAIDLNSDWSVKTKYGDQIVHDRGLFGRNKTLLETRSGKVYESKSGLFGSRSQNIQLKNAKVERSKGWFGRGQSNYSLGPASLKQKDGLFGRDSKELNLLGNSVTRKKGLFGSHTTEVKTMFGDTVTTKKGWFGRTRTEVEPGGVSAMFASLFKFI